MTRYIAPLILALAAALIGRTAHAQFAVIDPANLIENTISALRAVEQVNNQLRSLEHEVTMLENDAKNLSPLNFTVLARLQAAIATTNALLYQTQSLSFHLNLAQKTFSTLYPRAYATTVSNEQMATDAHDRWLDSLEALRTSISAQSIATDGFGKDLDTMTDLVEKSQSSVGALQALQATNQLLALHARESVAEQQLRITQDRAVALEHARAIAAEERARVVRRQFNANGVPYTP